MWVPGDAPFPEQSLERLAGIGRWTKVNGESIYGTRRSFEKGRAAGSSTMKGAGGARGGRVCGQIHRRRLLVHHEAGQGVRQRVHEAGRRVVVKNSNPGKEQPGIEEPGRWVPFRLLGYEWTPEMETDRERT